MNEVMRVPARGCQETMPPHLSTPHRRFEGSVLWSVSRNGIEVQGKGLIPSSPQQYRRAERFLGIWGGPYAAAASRHKVPVELIIACSLTEAGLRRPATECCKEPGYIDDETTPHRISVGLMQMLISTARETMRNPRIDRAWLQDPWNATRAGAAYMRKQYPKTGFDPPLVAAAYNSGGVYFQGGAGNRWKLRQYPIGTSRHVDRFVEYFNAVMALTQPRGVGINAAAPRMEDWL